MEKTPTPPKAASSRLKVSKDKTLSTLVNGLKRSTLGEMRPAGSNGALIDLWLRGHSPEASGPIILRTVLATTEPFAGLHQPGEDAVPGTCGIEPPPGHLAPLVVRRHLDRLWARSGEVQTPVVLLSAAFTDAEGSFSHSLTAFMRAYLRRRGSLSALASRRDNFSAADLFRPMVLPHIMMPSNGRGGVDASYLNIDTTSSFPPGAPEGFVAESVFGIDSAHDQALLMGLRGVPPEWAQG